MTAGNRAMWIDKHSDLAVFVDIRHEMRPDVIADSRLLPFSSSCFDLALFDPPHLNVGPTSRMAKSYGHWTTKQINELIRGVSMSAARVIKPGGLMAFKWNNHDQSCRDVLGLMWPLWRPLFGQIVAKRTKHPSETYWIMLQRRP